MKYIQVKHTQLFDLPEPDYKCDFCESFSTPNSNALGIHVRDEHEECEFQI